MSKVTVTMEVTIPEGYELAESAMRRVKPNEWYFNQIDRRVELWLGPHPTLISYPILSKLEPKQWKPKLGERYWFPYFSSKTKTLITNNDGCDLDTALIANNLAFRTSEQAIECHRRMVETAKAYQLELMEVSE